MMQLEEEGEFLSYSRRLKVLLVDDDKLIHDMLEIFLDKTEYSLISALNVEEAMKAIALDPPDIIITDAMMPGESGFYLIDKIKLHPRTINIPIILWTILEYPDGSVMDASKKADILIKKPFYESNIMEGLELAKQLIECRKVIRRQPENSFDRIRVAS